MADTISLTCSSCRHWSKVPRQSIGDPDRGDCLEGPPHCTSVVNQMGQVIGQISAYPQLRDTFPACHRFAPALKVLSDG